ncbi:MAG: glycosyltransferase [Deltaproteobacteria bacterium]|nr:glycosyltransferase [Deltaproteobacteria bacterium]
MHKLLILTSLMPYPPQDGASLRNWHMCKQLSQKMDVTVLGRTITPLSPDVIQSASSRSLHFEMSHIDRPSLPKKAIGAFRLLFSSYPIQIGGYEFARQHNALTTLLAQTKFDFIQIDPWLYSYWPQVKETGAITVVSYHNIESELLIRQAKIETSIGRRLLKRLDAKRMERIEASLFHEADISIVTTKREQVLLKERFPNARILVAPNGVDFETIQVLPPRKTKRILFVGTLDYDPNIDAVTHFVRNIFPILRSRYRDITFHVAGLNPGPRIMLLNNEPNVQIHGFVPNLRHVYQEASVCVAPLRAGSGSRLKILEAMAYGRPVVSTQLGCEGLQVETGTHLLIADKPEEFANAIGNILDDPNMGRKLAANARKFVEIEHSWKSIVEMVLVEFESVMASLNQFQNNMNQHESVCYTSRVG